MNKHRIPIFIASPFIGQGDILNEEWIDGRIALFEAVTKKSLLHLTRQEDVHWLIFLGRNPTTKVVEYATTTFEGIENIHLMESRFNSENINDKAKETSPVENYITILIADDDAWPKNYISTVREKANHLLDMGDEHAGMTFSNGLEWVMSDQVDIHFLQKAGYNLLRKQNLVEYNYPWLGCGFFVLQTKSRPFNSICNAHPTIPKWLKKEGFSIHVAESPSRAWLYNRHQLSASSLVKSESEPVNFTLEELEEEFGIDAKKVAGWKDSRFSSYYSEKAQGVGMLDMYDFPDLEDFVHMPFKSFFLNNGYFTIDILSQFNIRGTCRLRIYDVTNKKYVLLFTLKTYEGQKLRFHHSMFDSSNEYKFDIQKQIDGVLVRVMPYILMKFKELDAPLVLEEEISSFFDIVTPSDKKTDLKLIISAKDSKLIFELPSSICSQCILDSSILGDAHSSKYQLFNLEEGSWNIIQEGTFLR